MGKHLQTKVVDIAADFHGYTAVVSRPATGALTVKVLIGIVNGVVGTIRELKVRVVGRSVGHTGASVAAHDHVAIALTDIVRLG